MCNLSVTFACISRCTPTLLGDWHQLWCQPLVWHESVHGERGAGWSHSNRVSPLTLTHARTHVYTHTRARTHFGADDHQWWSQLGQMARCRVVTRGIAPENFEVMSTPQPTKHQSCLDPSVENCRCHRAHLPTENCSVLLTHPLQKRSLCPAGESSCAHTDSVVAHRNLKVEIGRSLGELKLPCTPQFFSWPKTVLQQRVLNEFRRDRAPWPDP